jgi:DNA repair photolyase
MMPSGTEPSISPAPPRGRGASINPADRFTALHYERDEFCAAEESRPLPTEFFRDDSQSIISRNNSPDVGFETSVNPYRGCEHGCAYCYARPTHEYLGFSAGLDFESKILVKPRAAALLREELSKPSWKPQVVVLSGVTDCYQPIERKLRLTRSCLEVLAEFRNPAAIITKNYLVTRDIDVLRVLARSDGIIVTVSVTTLDADLAAKLEPRASTPRARLAAVRELANANIPVGVNVAPIIPGLNDHEIPQIVQAAAEAGAQCAHYTIVRLPLAVAQIFSAWLRSNFPDRADTVLGRIRSIRNGKLNSAQFGQRMRGDGILAEQIQRLFEVACRRFGLNERDLRLRCDAFRRVEKDQLSLEL